MNELIIRDSSHGTVEFIQKLIEEHEVGHLEKLKSFEEGLLIGLKAGIYYSEKVATINSKEQQSGD